MHCSKIALSALHLVESGIMIKQSYSCERDPQNTAECWISQSFCSILGTDVYLLAKHNLHMNFVLIISAVNDCVTVA